MTGFDREFMQRSGVVIKLSDVIAGARSGVLASIRGHAQEAAALALDKEAVRKDKLRELEEIELDLARLTARARALTLVLEAAERELS